MVLEKINSNFLNDDFLKSLIEVKYPNEPQNLQALSENDSRTLFDIFLEFANECYIHGVTVGMKVASELYEEDTF